MFCNRVPSAKGVQTEHIGATRAGSGRRSADGHVGWGGGVCARCDVLEPGIGAR